MAIDNPVLLKFVNETIRPTADRLGGLIPLLDQITNAAVGQGLAAILGTDDNTLFRAEPWTEETYGALGAPQAITGSDEGGRSVLTNYHVIGILRVVAAIKAMVAANPALGSLVGAVADATGMAAILMSLGTSATGYTSSDEGTTTASRNLDAPHVTSLKAFQKIFPLGERPLIQIAKFGRIRVTAAAAVNMLCYMKLSVTP